MVACATGGTPGIRTQIIPVMSRAHEPFVLKSQIMELTPNAPYRFFFATDKHKISINRRLTIVGFSLLPTNNGTQCRSRTYVKGLEDPCTIRYTNRAYWRREWGSNPRYLSVLLAFQASPFSHLGIPPYLATKGGVDPHTIPGTTSFQD